MRKVAGVGLGVLGVVWVAFAPTRAEELGVSEVLATIDGQPITEALAEEAAPAIHQARTALYEARRRAAEEAIGKILLEREAKRRGITVEQLLETEVYSKVGQIASEEVRRLYEANQARLQQPFEKMAADLERYLRNQRAASWRASLVSELRKGARIEFLIDRPRVRVDAIGPSRGPSEAPVTIVEFSDFQCPFCANAGPVLKQVLDAYRDQVRVVYRDFPIDAIHPQARKAAEAARCADEQGKFWEYHDKLFTNQQALGADGLKRYAEKLGLDTNAFAVCLDSAKFKAAVENDRRDAEKAGVSGTPTFFVNGQQFVGVPSLEAIRKVIEEELQRVARRGSSPSDVESRR